jgi:hypothetical protein
MAVYSTPTIKQGTHILEKNHLLGLSYLRKSKNGEE